MASKATADKSTAKKSTGGSMYDTTRYSNTAQRIRDAGSVAVSLLVVRQVRIPRPEELAYYGGPCPDGRRRDRRLARCPGICRRATP